MHLILVFVSFFWSVTGERRRPKCKFDMPGCEQIDYLGDALFMFHLMLNSNYGVLMTQIAELGNRDELGSMREDLASRYQVDDSPSGSLIRETLFEPKVSL